MANGDQSFDAPAIISAQVVEDAPGAMKRIRVTLSATFDPPASDRWSIEELEYEVQWMGTAHTVTGFEPTTQLASKIAGTVKVEERKDNTATIGLNLSSGYFDAVKGGANAQASHLSGRTVRFEETPQHQPVVTAGTIHRGTGVRFRFRPSRTATLEGQRTMVIEYQVPDDWRMGLLKVHARARASQTIVAGIVDRENLAEAFVVPLYLEGDDEALRAARKAVQAERELRETWQAYRGANALRPGPRPPRWLEEVLGKRTAGEIPDRWLYALIQSDDRELVSKIESRLPRELQPSAKAFVAARQELIEPEMH